MMAFISEEGVSHVISARVPALVEAQKVPEKF